MRKFLNSIDYNVMLKERELVIVDNSLQKAIQAMSKPLSTVLCITSFLPRECGIATYSGDLVKALRAQFGNSIALSICPLESDTEIHVYDEPVKYSLNVDQPCNYAALAYAINGDEEIVQVLIQHEFGFFESHETDLELFVSDLEKPVNLVFHTVLPNPNPQHLAHVRRLAAICAAIVVLTKSSANLLINQYQIPKEKVKIIPHGTHLVSHGNKELLKEKYNLSGHIVLSTFGLLSEGKSIETTLAAMPAIIDKNPQVLFLIIGKTHPSVVKREGEKYRQMLEKQVNDLGISKHVRFVNTFLPLSELLEYLQLTDVYLFTSKDPNQAVSGTFSYAISSGCPIISTPIPHAIEVLKNDAGIIFDFGDSKRLAEEVVNLISDESKRNNISFNALHLMASTAWQNSAIAHAALFVSHNGHFFSPKYQMPPINLAHFQRLTTLFGMIQFSKINLPDIDSGYTIDDNARAMVALCQYYELTFDQNVLPLINIYLEFIRFCQQDDGQFLNYVDEQENFTVQNFETNLEDSNGRTVWALGYLISMDHLLPTHLSLLAISLIQNAMNHVGKIHSTRAIAFSIKGLYYRGLKHRSDQNKNLVKELANRLVQMYRHESKPNWRWFESYLTYANSILPEALLCAWIATGDVLYKEIAVESFHFLLDQIFVDGSIKVVSNKHWSNVLPLEVNPVGGEQPIDVAYTVIALARFYEATGNNMYKEKMHQAFNWFLGDNHLKQIIYNPITGGCYDGLEEHSVNLNQGAESTVSYLMARLTLEKVTTGNFKKNGQRKAQSMIEVE